MSLSWEDACHSIQVNVPQNLKVLPEEYEHIFEKKLKENKLFIFNNFQEIYFIPLYHKIYCI